MSRKIYILLAAVVISINLTAQFPGWAWEKTPVGSDNGYNNQAACATDAAGNLYVTGGFSSATVVFGSYTLTRSDTGNGDLYLVKYDPSGNVVWAKSAGGNGEDFGNGVALDATGNIYICGWFFGDSMVFPGSVLHSKDIWVTLHTGNSYVAKYDPSGNFVWARSVDTTSYGPILTNGITTDLSGNVYAVCGEGIGVLIIGGDTVNNSSSSINVFLMKLDAGGNVIWGRNAGVSGSYANGYSVATDGAQSVYITGYFNGGPVSFGSTTLTNAGASDIFIAKYDAGGNPMWAKSAGGSLSDAGNGIASDQLGNLYLTGYFVSDSITFGSITLYRLDTVVNGADFFIVNFDSSGNALWAQQASGIDYSYNQRIATDKLDNIFVTGTFLGTTFSFGSNVLTNAGGIDGFIVKYNPSGLLQWLAGIQGTGDDIPSGIAGDGNGNFYITGVSGSPSLQFGNTTFTNTDTPSYQLFIAKAGFASGIAEPVINDKVIIYPNPCLSGNCQLLVTANLVGCTLQVLDLSGRLLYKSEVENIKSQIPVSNFEAGMYIVKLTAAGNEITGKLIVTR